MPSIIRLSNRYVILIALFSSFFTHLKSQNCNTLNIKLKSDITSACSTMAMTMMHDAIGKPYLYVANKEAGLKVYKISKLDSPKLVISLQFFQQIDTMATFDVMNLTQSGNYLFLVLGNSFTNPQEAGLAIIDVSNPELPIIKDTYQVPLSNTGGGIVKVEGNYAYLGAMGSGLVILDISDVNHIQFVSQFKPDINYPVKNPNAKLYNARGMAVKNSIVYLCYDAGGFRIINCTDKTKPVETGRYANPSLHSPINLPRAYNNIILDDTLVYIAVDYCGMEILNIKDTSNIKLQGWWNPDHCPGNNWFTSPVHANEIQYDEDARLVFISTGKSDMMVLNVSNPSNPDSCSSYGNWGNKIGTWGAGLYQNQIYLSYICTAGIPFVSTWTGVKILTYNRPVNIHQSKRDYFSIFPNPANNQLTIRLNSGMSDANIRLYNYNGLLMDVFIINNNELTIKTDKYPQGLYYLKTENVDYSENLMISIQH